ncbi:hypothetical protein MMC07_006319 [Pseudocyphellaria aurata]|nr:hypothetical protein [Pseudocyphellaria aurata]
MTTLHITSILNYKMSATGDPMELTSDMDRRQMADEDIDLDLDLTGDQPPDGEDDYMAEDVNLTIEEATYDKQLAQTSRDDEMLDEYQYSLREAADNSSAYDEDLDDAVYPLPEEPVELLVEPSSEHSLEHTAEWHGDTLQGQETDVIANDNHLQPDSRLDHSEIRDATLSQPPEELILSPRSATQGDDDSREPMHHPDYTHNLSSAVPPANMQAETATVTRNFDPGWGSTTPKDEDESQSHSPDPENRKATPDGIEIQHENALTVATYIHPVTVVYQGSEMSLFPPKDEDQEHSQTYLLHDEGLASESIMNLFLACRLILADSIEEDDELEINVGELGLQISEVCISKVRLLGKLTVPLQSATECSSTTLAQIVDLYVQLQKNDGFDNPAPLYLVLSTKAKFSRRFDYLLSAVTEGKGLSQLVVMDSAEEEDLLPDNQFEQESVQRSYLLAPKPIFGEELDADSVGHVDADEDPGDEPELTPQQLEDLKPDSQDHEDGGDTRGPLSENLVIANHANQTEEFQTNPDSLEYPNDEPNKHRAGDLINGPSQSDHNAIPRANLDQDAVEEQGLLDYEEKDNVNPRLSTGSSTVQNDVRKVTLESSNQVSKEPTSAAAERNVASTGASLDSDSANAPFGRSSKSSFLNDVIEDDLDYAAHIEITEECPSDDFQHDEYQKSEDEPEHLRKQISATDLQDTKVSRGSRNMPEQESYVSDESSIREDPHPSYTLIDPNIGTDISPTDLTKLDTLQSARSDSLVSELDGANTIFDSNESTYNNTTDSLEDNQNAAQGDISGQEAGRAVHVSTSQNLRTTSSAQEQLADTDEITYEDDGNEIEPTKAPVSEQKSNSSPSLLKRMRSDHEDHDEIDSSVQGKLNFLASIQHLISMKTDPKRHRPA